jgi:prepilin-type processing-associated H-X9-DG protein
MSTDFYRDLEFIAAVPKPRLRRRFTIVEILFVIGTVLVVIALAMPSTTCCGPAMRRAQCVNNLKQIGLALCMYEQEYKALPPAYIVDAQERPLHSWRTLILPYLDQKDLYATINLSRPWNDPANATAQSKSVSVFVCPSTRGPGPWNTTNYLAIVADNGCLLPTRPRPLAEITDDHSSTLMVIEVDDERAVPWMAPTDADESLVLNLGTPRSNLHHSGDINAGFVDGRVRSLKANTKPDVRRALMSISGGERITDLK